MTSVVLDRIQDVLPSIPRWSIKVVVHDIAKPQQSYSSPKRYQRIVFADGSGQKAMATIFDNDISKFEKVFVLFETYKISNAKITPLAEKYNKFGYPYQWIITARTAISHEIGHAIPRSATNLNFASIGQLKSSTQNDELKDVLVIVIEKWAMRTIVASGKQHIVRDFAVINQDKKPVILTLWNSVAETEGKIIEEAEENMPIIRATRLSVSSYYGISLASTPTTAITVDPQIIEAQNLKNWRANNGTIISDALASKEYLDHEDSFHATTEKEIYPLIDAQKDKFVVRVRAKITDYDQKFFYMGCNQCFSGVDAELNHSYTCASCKEDALAKPRAKLFLNIYDGSEELDVIVFGDAAAKILQVNSTVSMEMYNAI
ncbi:PREDICTED: replication protein A 70 kDa DNA-binding subunit B-like [Erythranthe guttata]|uniref:replication protein A 70 kDa DNA-binding subunit B-like n=1 Tax=Erythranthe guttata TaxID=4155 RepID=UPI00064DFF18|nr:PREDICTED: replication protein A 70 kDa DNA-binding subunit B-like [Erythranthe guttata]|eukprot:XP_012844865.1 PREDICTED: replication protein A 70 kDa DNA-binding subunit B-like [Erythranthe guttata]